MVRDMLEGSEVATESGARGRNLERLHKFAPISFSKPLAVTGSFCQLLADAFIFEAVTGSNCQLEREKIQF
jgi:hypothetical protein